MATRDFFCAPAVSRRQVLGSFGTGLCSAALAARASGEDTGNAGGPWFRTRGTVVVVKDVETNDWPALAKQAGLTTLATHIRPGEIAAFVQTEEGRRFLDGCLHHGIAVEHELHAMGDLLPRELSGKDPTMFRLNEKGERVSDFNLCVHSAAALDVVAENAARYTQSLRSTTGRYFYWNDGDYAKRWGVAPVEAYGEALRGWCCMDGRPQAPRGTDS